MRKFASATYSKAVFILALCLAGGTMSAAVKSIYDFTLKSIDGKPTSLKEYHGKVVMLVNVASKCGFTPQYAGLEKLYETYKDKGFVIVGIPANNFAQQEPGTDAEIKKFCTNKYNVSFPMMSKVSVKGDDITPLYVYSPTSHPIPNSAAKSSGTSPSSSSTATATRSPASSPT